MLLLKSGNGSSKFESHVCKMVVHIIICYEYTILRALTYSACTSLQVIVHAFHNVLLCLWLTY